MKTFFKLLLIVGLAAYLVVAFIKFVDQGHTTRCTEVSVLIADSLRQGFITRDEVERILRKDGLYPTGREMDAVDGRSIELALMKNPFISSATCYKTTNGRVNILITQRLPLLRIQANDGSDYYIDETGQSIRTAGYRADLPIATGHITPRYAARELTAIGRFLRNHPFWNDQIVQIDVDSTRRLTLIPRVGCQVIRFGRADSTEIAQRFRHLRALYTKVLPTVGWNTYTEVNLEYTGQIICKKQ